MKNLILVAASIFIVSLVNGQTLAKKRHHSSPEVVDQMTIQAYRTYATEVGSKIDFNDHQIADIRFFVTNVEQNFNKKAIDEVIALQNENNELKTDLNNFTKYGEGDWHLFQKEFNKDLQNLSADIEYMHARFLKDYLMALK